MAVLLAQRQKKFYHRGDFAYRKCGTLIYIYKLSTLAEEFSVRCPKCGDRGVYLKRRIAIQELPERSK